MVFPARLQVVQLFTIEILFGPTEALINIKCLPVLFVLVKDDPRAAREHHGPRVVKLVHEIAVALAPSAVILQARMCLARSSQLDDLVFSER